MQYLNWLAKCLVLRTVPASLLRQEEARIKPEEFNLETVPLQPSLHSLPARPHQMCVRALSFKNCTNGAFILLGAAMLGVLITLVNVLVASWPGAPTEKLWQREYLESVCNNSISQHLRYLTKAPHVAGSPENFATADYVQSTFVKYGLEAHHIDFNVLLSYPLHRSLILTQPVAKPIALSLQEKAVSGDPYSNDSRVIPTFHAYAPSGNASAEVVYAFYGRTKDFQKLSQLGVKVEGAIVIARYGKIYRGDVVENAARAGAVAVVIYSDPQDYAANGTGGFYPDSQWLPPSGVQRGSVFRGIGDPLTPGWASSPDAERLSMSDPKAKMPRIPSLPISADDALPILRSLEGFVAPPEWWGALDLPQYNLGRGPGRLNLSYVANHTVTPIRNVFATIPGALEPDRFVLLGNHRDAWTFGAVDPNSGTAALLELARVFGEMKRKGWRPQRSIVLCSWDAEEYGLVGSTEWVEQNSDILGANAVAYLNVDCAVAGPAFNAASSPQLDLLLMEVTKQVNDPDSEGQTLFDSWVATSKKSPPPFVDRLGGGGSDYAAFLQHAGVPAIDIFFGDGYPVYHSLYDNYNWMEKFGDPMFHRHVAVTTVWGLIAMRLANDAVLPLDYEKYASELQAYTSAIDIQLKSAKAPKEVSVESLLSAINDLQVSVMCVMQELQAVAELGPELQQSSSLSLVLKRRGLNDRLLKAERAFLDDDGIPGDSWYKHLVYGPVANNGYESLSFPGILDAIYEASSRDSNQNWAAVQHEIFRATRVIRRAALVLRGKLT